MELTREVMLVLPPLSTREAEKRDPGKEVVITYPCIRIRHCVHCPTRELFYYRHYINNVDHGRYI